MQAWKIYIALILLGLTFVLGLIHVLIFGDLRTLEFYLLLDVVFVPIQVLLVSIVIERLLSEREKESMIRKLNMVVGAFMGELGSRLLVDFNRYRIGGEELESGLRITGKWKKEDYRKAQQLVESFTGTFDPTEDDLVRLRNLLLTRRPFVLSMLQNPNLLEHETFTDLLWAICHLTEELECRKDLADLPESDLNHLRGDINRAYGLLAREWLTYARHLQDDYPYIFSLSMRTNPFLPDASPIVS